MNLEDIKEQARISNEAIRQMNVQQGILETVIMEALKKAPEKDKEAINKVQKLMIDAKALIKNGKLTEAQNLINSFTNGGQDNK